MGALLQPRCWLPIVEAPGYSRHPTPILAMQLLTCNIIFYMKFNRPFCLFSFHKDQKFIDTAGKTTLKLGNLQSLKVICPKRAKILLHKVAKFFRHWWAERNVLAPPHPHPHHKNIFKILCLCNTTSWLLFKNIKFKFGNFTDFSFQPYVQGLFPLTGPSQIKKNKQQEGRVVCYLLFLYIFPGI